MKTSLNIDDSLFFEAKKMAHKNKKTLSETLSHWALVGYATLKKERKKLVKLTTADLGGSALIDLNSRKDWMDLLDSK